MTGYNWNGDEVDFRRGASQYGAIHFHDDDLEDASWESDFILELDQQLCSGIYAIRLRGDGAEDHIPFLVRPAEGTAPAPIAVLAPTMTYLAYANQAVASGIDKHGVGLGDRARWTASTTTWTGIRSWASRSTTAIRTAAASSIHPNCDPSSACGPGTATGSPKPPATWPPTST